jgi:vancomycin resistance protein YoaR
MAGKTVLGDGGGICQVSTTLFRAALNSGLPISEYHAHAYRVGYYENDAKPGLDATVFGPTVDFKFINNTPASILIQTIVDKENNKLLFIKVRSGDEYSQLEPNSYVIRKNEKHDYMCLLDDLDLRFLFIPYN